MPCPVTSCPLGLPGSSCSGLRASELVLGPCPGGPGAAPWWGLAPARWPALGQPSFRPHLSGPRNGQQLVQEVGLCRGRSVRDALCEAALQGLGAGSDTRRGGAGPSLPLSGAAAGTWSAPCSLCACPGGRPAPGTAAGEHGRERRPGRVSLVPSPAGLRPLLPGQGLLVVTASSPLASKAELRLPGWPRGQPCCAHPVPEAEPGPHQLFCPRTPLPCHQHCAALTRPPGTGSAWGFGLSAFPVHGDLIT